MSETPTQNPSIESIFTFHAPTPEQAKQYVALREKAKELAYLIDESCPGGPSRTTAINKLRESVMWANASIATDNAQYR